MQGSPESYLAAVRARIDAADAAYYRPGIEPIMTDREYEVLKLDLRTLAPGDHRLTRVGVPYSPEELRSKKPHRMPMGSLDNTDGGIIGLEDWYAKTIAKAKDENAAAVVVSDKMDGNSVSAIYDANGVLVSVISRGDGAVGEDVTANAVLARGVPAVLPQPVACSVRGEMMLYKGDFEEITKDRDPDDKSNPRNIGSGILGRDNGKDARRLRLVAFNISVEREFATVVEKLDYIKSLGFEVVRHEQFEAIETVEEYYDRVLQERSSLPYEIDGLVIELNSIVAQKSFITKDPKSQLRPKYARAIKFPMHFAQTKCVGVTVTVGHTGTVVPTAQLAPVWVGGEHQGVTVKNALLTNYNEVQRLGLAVGDTVEVALAGDIIPKIIRVVERPADRKPIKEPTHCPTCGDATTRESRGKSGANLYCSNEECPGVMVGKIHHWIGSSKKGVGILDIGDAMEAALYEQGLVTDPSELYKLRPEQIEDVLLNGKTRIGRSRAEKVVANIQAKKELPLHVFLGSLGVDLLGRRRVQLLAGAAGGELDRLEDWLDDEKLSTIQVPGMGEEMRQAIRNGLSRCKPLIKRLLEVGVVAQPIEKASAATLADFEGAVTRSLETAPFAGKNFVFTGTREGIPEVETRGGHVQDGIRKDTHYLVQKGDKLTSKAEKAMAQGVKVISLDLFRRIVAGEAELPQ